MIIENGKWTVYAQINIVNGKVYIGITSQTNPEKRWGVNGCKYKGCVKFWCAIKKYGWDSFEHEIIASHLTKDEANNMEKLLIVKFDSINNGYNMEPGGVDQGPRSPEAIEKLREARKRQVITPEMFKKGALARTGKKHSPEWIQHCVEAQRKVAGKPVMCIETNISYDSVAEAAEKTGIQNRTIWAAANRYNPTNKNNRKTKLHWKFI